MSVKRILATLLGVATLVVVPAVALAGYSPANRQTFQCVTPTNCPGANYVTFNSFTNAPNYGDERAFFDAKDASITSAGGYQDKLTVHDGQKIVMRVYIHNNANPKAIGDAAATAKNTRMQVLLPTAKQTNLTASASVTADNANPGTVSDTVDMTGVNPFTLTFDRSAPVQVTYRPNGTGDFVTRPLPGATFANDQTLNTNFGDWKGCFEFAALVTFTATVHMEQPKPEAKFACEALNVTKVSRTRFDFTANASATNANITGYVFTTKDANGNVVDTLTVNTSAKEAKYTFNRDVVGTYTTSVVVKTDKGDAHADACVKQVKVEEAPVTPPVVSGKTTELPNTGAGAVAGIFAGVSALAGAGHYVFRRYIG